MLLYGKKKTFYIFPEDHKSILNCWFSVLQLSILNCWFSVLLIFSTTNCWFSVLQILSAFLKVFSLFQVIILCYLTSVFPTFLCIFTCNPYLSAWHSSRKISSSIAKSKISYIFKTQLTSFKHSSHSLVMLISLHWLFHHYPGLQDFFQHPWQHTLSYWRLPNKEKRAVRKPNINN